MISYGIALTDPTFERRRQTYEELRKKKSSSSEFHVPSGLFGFCHPIPLKIGEHPLIGSYFDSLRGILKISILGYPTTT